jgi:ubiquinone/menaquinone biosynthesis C-methylase UbiE
MALDLSSGKRIYDWLGRHPLIYKGIRWSVCFGHEDRLQRLAISALGLKKGGTVLDLACGAGVNQPFLVEAVGEMGRVIAVDYSDGMLAAAQAQALSKGWQNIEFRQSDASQMQLAPCSLDGALCTFGLSAMPGETDALHHIARALKPNASLVVLDAKSFTGWARMFNPMIGPLFKHTTNWNYEKDIVAVIREVFEHIELREFHSGHNYIVVAKRVSAASQPTSGNSETQ